MSGSNALQIGDPDAGNPLAQAPSDQSVPDDRDDFYNVSPLERWLAQQRAKNAGSRPESLPGITSGAAPKPWGLNSDQLAQMLNLQQQRNSQQWQAAEDQRIQQKWANTYLGRVLPPVDYSVDPSMMLQRLPGASPDIRMPSPTFPRWEMRPSDRET